jgi:hypothetical protein
MCLIKIKVRALVQNHGPKYHIYCEIMAEILFTHIAKGWMQPKKILIIVYIPQIMHQLKVLCVQLF